MRWLKRRRKLTNVKNLCRRLTRDYGSESVDGRRIGEAWR